MALTDPRIIKYANVIVDYSLHPKKRDVVVIQCTPLGEPLALECYRRLIKVGCIPHIRMSTPAFNEIFLKEAADWQLKFVSPLTKYEYKRTNGAIGINAPYNRKFLSNVDSSRMVTSAKAHEELNDLFMRRYAEGKVNWIGVNYPTQAFAQEAEMSLDEYTEFLCESCFLNDEDPVASWKKLSKKQEKVCEFLNKVKTLRFVGLDTDFKVSVKGRKWINCDASTANLPDGEVFSAPIEDSATGPIRFTFPGIYMGKEIEDIKLKFRKGKVVDFDAVKGKNLLKNILKMDPGAGRIGEVAFGTNYGITRFTKSMLFDEKIGGTVHIALGRGFDEAGSKNKSAIHWDILKDMRDGGEVYADGKLFYKDGKFIDFEI
jgi:aminopeptidase